LFVWQLADSAFPIGGFAHSGGLEAAWQHGEVRTRDELFAFLETALEQSEHNALPFVVTAHAEPGRLPELDHLCDTFFTNHVANRASRLLGRAFLTAVKRIFREHRPRAGADGEITPLCAGLNAGTPFAHFAPTFGASLHLLGLQRDIVVRLFLFNHLRSLVAAAVRLNIVGPMEGQAIQFRMVGLIEKICTRSGSLTLENLAQTAPLLEIWQGAQDRLYSRLFQS
jgi:urease accessory protein